MCLRDLARAWTERLKLVNGSLVGDFDIRPECIAGLFDSPEPVELVGDVRQHEPAGARSLAVLARLPRREVAALAGALRPWQGGLEQAQRGLVREADTRVGPAAVGCGGQLAAAVRRLRADRVGLDEVRDGVEVALDRADLR